MHLLGSLSIVLGLAWLQISLAIPDSVFITEDTSGYPGGPWMRPPHHTRATNVCHVPAPADGGDAAPGIVAAFQKCGQNGQVIFDNTTYHINSVMNTTGLSNVEVAILGTLLWSNDTAYWLNHSLPVGYQNQSSAWFFGGDNVWMHGYGFGTFNGNGQIWYDHYNGNNYPGRPHQITFSKLTNSLVAGVRFVQSQMWTMTLINSANVLLRDIYVNSTNANTTVRAENTDGANTIYANNITFLRWSVTNGDDSIACKANSTNILIQDTTFYKGLGFAMGSIGQYLGQYERIENVTARNITMNNVAQGAYIKTWKGIKEGDPPNGGGGGTGYLKNVTFTNMTLNSIATSALSIGQCTTYNPFASPGNCDTSKFQISDVHFTHVKGSQGSTNVASIQCSGAVPCPRMEISDVQMTSGGKLATGYLCSNVTNPIGFTCTGLTSQT